MTEAGSHLRVLRRALTISGALAVAAVAAIPLAAASPGSVVGEAISIVWLLSLAPVVIGVHRLVVSPAGALSLASVILGLAAIALQATLLLATVVGLAGPLQNVTIGAAAYAATGLWLVIANALLLSAGWLSRVVGWFGAAVGLMQLISYVLLLVGGFPTSTDPAALASLGPATIAGSLLGVVSTPLYAVWAIWAGRRLPSGSASRGMAG